jgi:hypothetical protein
MAVRKKRRRGWRWPRRGHGHDGGDERARHEEELAARLAPLEETEAYRDSEQADAGKRAPDTIRVDNTTVKMPEKFLGGDRDVEGTFYIDPPVLAVLVVVLIFIAFIAWQISQMPEK